MDRRAYLTGLVAASAGCLEKVGNRRAVELVSSDDIPSRFNTEGAVEVLKSKITHTQTAQAQVTIRNTSDTAQEYGFDPSHPPIAQVVGEAKSGPRNLLLADPQTVSRRGFSPCWRPAQDGHGDGTARVKLAPGEEIQNTLALWDSGIDETKCLPPGDYQFPTAFGYSKQESTINWSFTLRLKKSG